MSQLRQYLSHNLWLFHCFMVRYEGQSGGCQNDKATGELSAFCWTTLLLTSWWIVLTYFKMCILNMTGYRKYFIHPFQESGKPRVPRQIFRETYSDCHLLAPDTWRSNCTPVWLRTCSYKTYFLAWAQTYCFVSTLSSQGLEDTQQPHKTFKEALFAKFIWVFKRLQICDILYCALTAILLCTWSPSTLLT